LNLIASFQPLGRCRRCCLRRRPRSEERCRASAHNQLFALASAAAPATDLASTEHVEHQHGEMAGDRNGALAHQLAGDAVGAQHSRQSATTSVLSSCSE